MRSRRGNSLSMTSSGSCSVTSLLGKHVRKLEGIEFPGIVVAEFQTTSGKSRIVVESTVLSGMLHIYRPDQCEVTSDEDQPA